MFLRKLTVIIVPLLLMTGMCLLLPMMNGLGFGSNVLKGLALGVGLALLLPVSGAGRKREPFAGLLGVPVLLGVAVVVYQHLASIGAVHLPVLQMLETTDGQVVLVECAFIDYMAVYCLRTKK